MPFKFIGKTTDFCGKSLWEILGNLKNFGVGRLVTRSRHEKYPEKSFIKILKVEALPNPKDPSLDNMRKVKVHVERTFRGVKEPCISCIMSASYKADYKLVPKNIEFNYLSFEKPVQETTILPKYMELPCLLQEVIKLESNIDIPRNQLQMPVIYNKNIKFKNVKIAEGNERYTKNISLNLCDVNESRLYKGLNLEC